MRKVIWILIINDLQKGNAEKLIIWFLSKKKKKEEESIWFMVKWGLGSNAIALHNYPFLFSKKKKNCHNYFFNYFFHLN